MELNPLLEKIDLLQAELRRLQPLTTEAEQQLWKKFRLEWNYNSNHIEGNTLTYGETELLLYFDHTKGNHSLREYEEMKGHDLALQMVSDYSKDNERPLNESFIRQLNQTLLKESFWKVAIAPDGSDTRKQIMPGEYKTSPNSVRTATGEIFQYASPQETPALMNDLVVWYQNNANIHPTILAADMHYKFVRIHPFDDGNGRTARLIMNYILLKHDLPPAIIKSKDKQNYIRALNLADVGDIDAFRIYIAEQLIWSLEKSLVVANGGNPEDDDDLEKEVAIFKRDLVGIKNSSNNIKYTKTVFELQKNVIEKIFIPIADKIYKGLAKLNAEFEYTTWNFSINGGSKIPYNSTHVMENMAFHDAFSKITFYYHLVNFKKSEHTSEIIVDFMITFERSKARIEYQKGEVIEFNYHQPLSTEEINQFVRAEVMSVINQMKKLIHTT
jgi:Fic family protein